MGSRLRGVSPWLLPASTGLTEAFRHLFSVCPAPEWTAVGRPCRNYSDLILLGVALSLECLSHCVCDLTWQAPSHAVPPKSAYPEPGKA